jgi:uncharacterized damage-inducible protein DinB
MTIGQSMIPEFDHEMANTRKTLERVPDAQFEFKPHEKSMSMGVLAHHTAEMVGWLAPSIEHDELNFEGWVPPPKSQNTAEVLALFDEAVPKARQALASVTDEAMLKTWTLRHGEQILMSLPRIAAIRGMIFNHIIHHRAQLSVYLRMNNVPVPALYGPSGDEKTF